MADPQSNKDNDLWMLKRMIAVEVYMSQLTAPEKKLYEEILASQQFDSRTFTVSYGVPANADPAALKKVMQVIDLQNDPAATVVLTQEMKREGDRLIAVMDLAAARKVMADAGIRGGAGLEAALNPPPAKLAAEFVWESPEDSSYTQHKCSYGMADFEEAVKFGAQSLALYFTTPGKPGRHFTNTGEIKDAEAVVDYLEQQEKTPRGIERDILTRMFSRVAQNPQEQAKWNGVGNVANAVALLKQEPEGTYFLTPSNGGFVKLEAEDKAYDYKGAEVWPPKRKPAKGFRQEFSPY